MKIIILSIIVFLTACSSTPTSKKKYQKTIRNKFSHDEQYNGFQNTHHISALLISYDVATAILDQKSDTLLWTEQKKRNEREKSFQEMSSETTVVLSLFTPNRKHNDLHKASSSWKIYLEVEGTRYNGVVKKSPLKFAESSQLFPFHNRWSKLYKVRFKVPTNFVQDKSPKLILTSSIGSSKVTLK